MPRIHYVAGERPPCYVTDDAGTTWRVFDVVGHVVQPPGEPERITHHTHHDAPDPAAWSRWFVRRDRFVRVASFRVNRRDADRASLLSALSGTYAVTIFMRPAARAAYREPIPSNADGRRA